VAVGMEISLVSFASSVESFSTAAPEDGAQAVHVEELRDAPAAGQLRLRRIIP
jgi:hypothetical protein